MSRIFLIGFSLIIFSFSAAVTHAQNGSAPVALAVDLREAPRRIFHTRMVFPAAPGPLTLLYPKWIPGEHGPNGPINNVAGMKFTAGGKPLVWRRDDVNMYAFHLTVPAGANAVEAEFDYLSPSEQAGYSASPAASAQLAVLNWHLVLLYPQGKPVAQFTYAAKLLLPAGWKFGTALPVAKNSGDTIEFSAVPLSVLQDSPVIAGAHYRVIPLPLDGAPPHEIDLAADSDAAIQMSPQLIQKYTQMVAEFHALFGAHHYRSYHFLYALSDHVERSGVEHHESSDDRLPERTLLDESLQRADADLLTHEFTHSWNGKYRRPAGLATSDFEQPMKDELLWVYEGLTQYLGQMMAARSGLFTPEEFRESVADIAARLDHLPGRTWRPLADTAVSGPVIYGAPAEWQSLRRGADFYDESLLIWLEADALIRQQSQGKRSLDDFCRAFHGGKSGPPELKTYTYDDVVAAMSSVVPYDWRTFFTTRLESTAAPAPLGGLEASGWRLVYSDKPNELRQAGASRRETVNLKYSLGLLLRGESGAVIDAVRGMPAYEAGISPGMKLVAVNGRKWTPELLRSALQEAKISREPIELQVENSGFTKTYSLDYHEGEKYPHLERDASRPDLLSEIIQAHAGKTAP